MASASIFSDALAKAAAAAAAAEAAAQQAAAQAAAAAKAAAAQAAAAAQSAVDTAKNAAQAVSDGVSTVVGTSIIFTASAALNLGGTFSDLFGSLTSLSATVPDGLKGFIEIDLSASKFLLTGVDPCFNASRDVFFTLYTNQNRDGQNISTSNIGSTTFNSSNPTRFVIHGYLNNGKSPMNVEITKAYLDLGNFNVVREDWQLFLFFLSEIFFQSKIIVDWGYGAFDTSYIDARLRVNAVSIQVSTLINYMISNKFATYDQVVVVGHSLGTCQNYFLLKIC